MKPFIYALSDPTSPDNFRYIGMSMRRATRPHDHLRDAKGPKTKVTYVIKWIRKLLSEGRQPIINVLKEFEEGTTASDVKSAEIDFIRNAKLCGLSLTNLTDGGDGAQGYRWTDEAKKRQSATTKAYHAAHPEMANKTSERNRQKFKNPEERAKVGDRFRGVIPSVETKEKVKAGLRKHFEDPQAHEIRSQALRGRPKSEAHKAALHAPKSEAHRKALKAAWVIRRGNRSATLAKLQRQIGYNERKLAELKKKMERKGA